MSVRGTTTAERTSPANCQNDHLITRRNQHAKNSKDWPQSDQQTAEKQRQHLQKSTLSLFLLKTRALFFCQMASNSDVVVPVNAPAACPSNTADAGRASTCDGCPGQALCKAGAGSEEPDKAQMDMRMGAIAHKIFVLSAKGGVGKSMVCCALAIALAKAGKRVAIADVDLCGPSVPRIMNVDAKVIAQPYGWVPPRDAVHGIPVMSIQFLLPNRDDPVVWRGPRKTNMIRRLFRDTFWGRLDFLIVDTPPGTSDEHLAALACAPQSTRDGCVLVTQPTPVSLAQTRREAALCTRMHAPVLGIVENMSGYVCTCCGEVSDIFGDRERSGGAAVAAELQCELLARVPLDPRLAESADSAQCLLSPSFESPATIALEVTLRNRILALLKAENETW